MNKKIDTSTSEDFVIITNSPGELSSWVRSTTHSLKGIAPHCRIIIVLVPCPYATGREIDIALGFPQVDLVLSPKDFLKISVGLEKGPFIPSRKGIVIFLGGDFWHALWIAKKLKYPAVAYAARMSRWNKYFELLFVNDERVRQNLIRRGIPMEKIEVVGNLMTDGIRAETQKRSALESWGMGPENLTVGLCPGSRLSHVRETIPIFLRVAEELKENIPEIQFLMSISPFIQLDEIEECVKISSFQGIEGSCGVLRQSDSLWEIITRQGVRIKLMKNQQYEAINASDLVLTIPGTNTAEIAALGRPMIVSFSWRARVPRGGLGSLLNVIPLQWTLRRTLMHMAYKKLRFKALPNQWAGREIVPEVALERKPEEITRVAIELLKDNVRRERISQELKECLGGSPHGAAEKIAHRIAILSAQGNGNR